MYICGIDPGIGRLGYALLKEGSSKDSRGVQYGCLETSPKMPAAERLLSLYHGLQEVFEIQPHTVAIEKLFFNKNATTALPVAEARGIVLLLCAQKHIPVFEYTPSEVKKAVAGYGRADKRQIQTMLQRILKLQQIPTPDDAADALAIALCHMQVYRFERRLKRGG